MKFKLTPLNIVTAISLVTAAMLIFNKSETTNGMDHQVNGLWVAVCFLAVVISFLTDQIFRKFIPSTRNLWVIECAFIIFTIVFVFILRFSVLS